MRIISGRQNPVVRLFKSLAGADVSSDRILLDGAHLVREAREAGTRFDVVAVASSRLTRDTEEGRLAHDLERAGIEVLLAPDQLFGVLSPVKTPSGIVAVAERRRWTLEEVCAPADAFLLVAVDVQDPGNLGSLLRAAEAGGVTGAIVCSTPSGAATNPFSWKALRGSMGSALRLPTVAGLHADEALRALRQAGVRTVAAVPRDGQDPDEVPWRGAVAIVLGGEGEGLDAHTEALCDQRVTIPMAPRVESLNVAVAAAILVYAARRARRAPAGPAGMT